MISAREALNLLREGNRRFAAGERSDHSLVSEARRDELAVAGQTPFAIVLGCSDSRVPAEIVFDQGLGDLFVIRVAGNIVAASQVGSIEFAASQFGSRLVVVLGHSQCGAVQATVEALRRPGGPTSPNVESIVDCIRPAVEPLLSGAEEPASRAFLARAVRVNVRASVARLRSGPGLLRPLVESGEVLVVGAEYSLDTGRVDFFDVPADARPTATE